MAESGTDRSALGVSVSTRVAIGGSILLLVIVLVAAALVLPACALLSPIFGDRLFFCKPERVLVMEERLEDLRAENAALSGEIAALEREIGQIQCVTQYFEPELPPPPPPPPEPVPEPEPAPPPEPPIARNEGVDPDRFRERDIAVLEGCWALDSEFRTRDVRTGRVTFYNQWNMCFDANGNGREQMRATNGVTCNGPVRGNFSGGGSLVITEPGNLRCSNGSEIFRRVTSCQVNPNGTASCVSRQPDRNTRSPVQLRRSQRTF